MNRKLLTLLLFVYAICVQVAFAQPMVRLYGGSPGLPVSSANPLIVKEAAASLANWTNTTVTLTGSAQTIPLTAPSYNVKIATSAAAAIVYINFNGTATTANYAIAPGGTFTYNGSQQISSISVLGASAAGTVSVMAF